MLITQLLQTWFGTNSVLRNFQSSINNSIIITFPKGKALFSSLLAAIYTLITFTLRHHTMIVSPTEWVCKRLGRHENNELTPRMSLPFAYHLSLLLSIYPVQVTYSISLNSNVNVWVSLYRVHKVHSISGFKVYNPYTLWKHACTDWLLTLCNTPTAWTGEYKRCVPDVSITARGDIQGVNTAELL